MNADWEGMESIEDVVQQIIEDISKEDRSYLSRLKGMAEKDLISLHFTLGMGIRNHFGLWTDNDLLKAECAKLLTEEGHEEPNHPDSMSSLIIRRLHANLNS